MGSTDVNPEPLNRREVSIVAGVGSEHGHLSQSSVYSMRVWDAWTFVKEFTSWLCCLGLGQH